ncbi:hypothetical protein, partial [Desulfovibrio piger]|uniref:hypothetical protein n=1 Tax=Desulfovibrio piger TaxID=901 RepID=UPI00197E08D8
FFPTLTVVGLPVLRKPRVAFQFTICRKKVLPPRAPPFQKLLPLGLCEDGRACEEEQAASSSEALYPGSMEICAF